ncbi:MAG: hypothetical protein JO263_10220 [Candidatus Eremiobacteraeota bacterium]|nr:hypothetical protein [Candidatus Eremiobacteraeota bacterium]
MNAIEIALIVFMCLFGGALLGMQLRRVLPEHHLQDDSKHVLEVGTGTMGMIAGLVLGLLVGSATGSYNTQRSNVIEMSAQAALLDRLLAHYGPGARESRAALRQSAQSMLTQLWPKDRWRPSKPASYVGGKEVLFDRIEDLKPKTDEQTSIKNMALGVALDLGRMRWLMQEEMTKSISLPLLVILTFWFTAVFLGLGLFAPHNGTTLTALALAAFAITGAIYLMMGMYAPFQGLLQIPSTPLQNVIAGLGK